MVRDCNTGNIKKKDKAARQTGAGGLVVDLVRFRSTFLRHDRVADGKQREELSDDSRRRLSHGQGVGKEGSREEIVEEGSRQGVVEEGSREGVGME